MSFSWNGGQHADEYERFVPVFFEGDWEDGRPKLSVAGLQAVDEEIRRSEQTATRYRVSGGEDWCREHQ